MDTQRLLGSGLGTRSDAAVKRRLAGALEPGQRRLTAAGVCSAAAAACAAAGFFALAAVAEDVLAARASWTHDAKWLALRWSGRAQRTRRLVCLAMAPSRLRATCGLDCLRA